MWYQILGLTCLFLCGLVVLPYSRVRGVVLRISLVLLQLALWCGLGLAAFGFLWPSHLPDWVTLAAEDWVGALERIDTPLLRPGWSWIPLGMLWAAAGLLVTELLRFPSQIRSLTRRVLELTGVQAQVETIQKALQEVDESLQKVRASLGVVANVDDNEAAVEEAPEPSPSPNGKPAGKNLLERLQMASPEAKS